MIEILLKQFSKNVQQIILVSDHEYEDIVNESYLVYYEHKDRIHENKNVFINELRKKCLKFNKYGKRLDCKRDFERFNQYESEMVDEVDTETESKENDIVDLISIQSVCTEDEYNFLLNYYRYGQTKCSEIYNIKVSTLRKRVFDLQNKIKKKLGAENGR